MRRPRTRSLTKASVDHKIDDSVEVVQTEENPLMQQSITNVQTKQVKQMQPFRQSGQQSKSEQSKSKKGSTLGRPKKNQPKKSLSSNNKIKRSTSLNDNYSPNVNYTSGSSSKINRTNLGFRRTPGTRVPNVNLALKSDSTVYPAIQNLIQGTSSSGNISNGHKILSNALLPQLQNHLQYPNYTQAGHMSGSTSRMVPPKPINTTERVTPKLTKNYMPMREIPPPRVVPIPTGRDDVLSQHIQTRPELSQRYEKSLSNESQRASVSHQHTPMNQEARTSTQSESRETGSSSCDICHSTGCSTQKTSTTISIKMTTVTEADQFGNMTTRTFVETDITPVAGSVESTDKTEIHVETDENKNRSNNVVSTTSPIASDQNKPNKTSSPVTPQETEIPESEQNQNHINQHSVPKPVIYKPVPQPIPLNLPKIIAGSSQAAARLENANLIHHNHALQNLLSTTQVNQLNLSANANSSKSQQQTRINRPILPAQNQQLQPRPERLKHNIESIINSVNSSPKSLTVNSSNLLRNQTSSFMVPPNSTNDDVNLTDSFTGLQDLDGISDSSPSTHQSQNSPSKKKTTTRKRSASKSTTSSASKRKNQRILPNKNSSEAQIVISPYMMKAANTFMSGNHSTMPVVTSSSTEACPSQHSSPYNTFIDSNSHSMPYYNSPPRPPIFNVNDATSALVNSINSINTLPIATTPHNNYSEISREAASTTSHSNSTIQHSNSSTPQVGSSGNTCLIIDPYNNPFVVPGIGGSSSESTPTVQFNNNESLVRSGSSSKTISTNGGGVNYDSRSSSVVNTLEPLPPYYHIRPIEAMGSVTDIWNEWNVGINGNPSVILMMERYGGKWVYENEYHLRKRRIIVKEVQVRSEQIGIYDALAELERSRNGNSLLWLSDWIRSRE
ncbi:12712_t:CDS:2 [Funneliformis geosporum]|uniref:12712_t:CDS:1 n=1 Tax=Funneliformis geosporum TaxID=1117311 RepID=A0A9W4S9X4_9GLOM|nr:12712_t:CDS:2 [Funneliformis geosporum]